MKKVELLSPAGNMESLIFAVQNGADAVYVGGKKFGARAFANNFDYDELVEAIKYCHLYGVKIYITVNTICFEEELNDVINYIEFLYKNHVDALIMQDLGLISIVRKIFPNMEIHASTQMHNHNDDGLELLKRLGIKRAVLDREMSLDEIKELKTDIEKEVFVHGALCISYSGCCLFSSMHGGRSGNRGECVGACRLPYKLFENEKEIKSDGDYLLSTKSLCTINNLDSLIDSGIASFKIEGRMKSKEYVGYITRLYRNKIDEYYLKHKYNVTSNEIDNIKKLYNRELTSGYLFNNYGEKIVNIKSSNHIGIHLGSIIKIDKNKIYIKLDNDINQEDGIRFDNNNGMIVNKLYNQKNLLVNHLDKGSIAVIDNKIGLKEGREVRKTIDSNLIKEINSYSERKIPVIFKCSAKEGQRFNLSIYDGFNNLEEYGNIVESANTSPTSYEKIKNQIGKVGGTPFSISEINIDMDENIFVPIKEINELRRILIEKLKEKREYSSSYIAEINKTYKKNSSNSENKNKKLTISLLVRNEEQLKIAINDNINYIYVDDFELYKKYKDVSSSVYFRMPRVFENKINLKNERILATELGAIEKYNSDNIVNTDYTLNVTNKYTIDKLKDFNIKRICLSPEIKNDTLKLLASNDNTDILVYGRVELMISKYCPMNMIINNDNRSCNLCTKNKYSLKDSNDNIYPLITKNHITTILDSKPFDLLDNIEELMKIGYLSFRIDLYDETKQEIENIIKVIRYAYEHRNN